MKIKTLILLLVCSITNHLNAQDNSPINATSSPYFGIYYSGGLSTQIHSYPEKDYGKHAEHFLPVFGLGATYSRPLNSWMTLRIQMGYIQKGCSSRGKVAIAPSLNYPDGEVITYNYNNRFHYLNGDATLTFKVNKWKSKPYFLTGIRNDLLLNYTIDYDIDLFSYSIPYLEMGMTYPPRIRYYDNFNRFNVGMLNGAGVEFKKGWYVEFITNFDFGYVVKNTHMKVRNAVSHLTLGLTF